MAIAGIVTEARNAAVLPVAVRPLALQQYARQAPADLLERARATAAGLRGLRVVHLAARLPLAQTDNPAVQEDWRYYHEQVEPLLGSGVEFVGEVGGATKAAFLGAARALLFPSNWPEPFGLVMAEALACGTPVIALDRGSVAEVVEDGVTGFVCETEEAMAQAVPHVTDIDRQRCRGEVVRRFCPERMAEQYERIYERLVEAGQAASR